jgi:hypothetical protein
MPLGLIRGAAKDHRSRSGSAVSGYTGRSCHRRCWIAATIWMQGRRTTKGTVALSRWDAQANCARVQVSSRMPVAESDVTSIFDIGAGRGN